MSEDEKLDRAIQYLEVEIEVNGGLCEENLREGLVLRSTKNTLIKTLNFMTDIKKQRSR